MFAVLLLLLLLLPSFLFFFRLILSPLASLVWQSESKKKFTKREIFVAYFIVNRKIRSVCVWRSIKIVCSTERKKRNLSLIHWLINVTANLYSLFCSSTVRFEEKEIRLFLIVCAVSVVCMVFWCEIERVERTCVHHTHVRHIPSLFKIKIKYKAAF